MPCSADQPWQFADLDSSPVHTYVAVLCVPAYVVSLTAPSVVPSEQPMLAPYTIGLFEAEPASRFDGFAESPGLISVVNPRNDRTCTLAFADPMHPVRTGCDVSCGQRCSDGFPCDRDRECASNVCQDGVCRPSRCAPSCGLGATCGSDLDCTSQRCVDGDCRPPSP